MKYLLAAEADRIQDLLFRSSKLREVAGGSLLLSRFCVDVPKLLQNQLGIGDERMEVITHGGGSFYITFDERKNAVRFSEAMAEAYARVIGGTLSYAEPENFPDSEYGETSDKAGKKLRQAKRSGQAVATEQMPYIAFCESCGVELAEEHKARFENETAHYYCHTCLAKAAEYDNKGGFLRAFNRDVVVVGNAVFAQADWQDEDKDNVKACDDLLDSGKMRWPHDPEDIAIYDSRRYVAYIVADGNGMGRVFRQCNKDQAHALSEYMDMALRRSLAKALRSFTRNAAFDRAPDCIIPAMPLIMGGDDLFALVPAPFALDIAGEMCMEFQKMMTDFAREHKITVNKQKDETENAGDDDQEIEEEKKKSPVITMSAAVIICKANYPYYLAHDLGKKRLDETKRAVKALAAKENLPLSAVNFEVVLGSQFEQAPSKGEGCATLRPYWVTDKLLPEGWGLRLQALLDARLHLAQSIASRRRSQLRALFDSLGDKEWDGALKELLERIEPGWEEIKKLSVDKDRLSKFPLAATLQDLGGLEKETWKQMSRLYDNVNWRGHGMGDLLRFWDWTLDLDHNPSEYEGGTS